MAGADGASDIDFWGFWGLNLGSSYLAFDYLASASLCFSVFYM